MNRMIDKIKKILFPTRARLAAEERENEARLAEAERELARLQDRTARAVLTLQARHRRNHWQEAIANIIQGA